MKIRILIFAVIIFLGGLTEFGYSQPPPPGGGHGSSNNQPPGGGAPVGEGLLFLITLGAAYGIKKMKSASSEEDKI